MNLPETRKISYGRTHSQSWDPNQYVAVKHTPNIRATLVYGLCLFLSLAGIGVMLAWRG